MSKPQDSGGFEKNFSDFTQLCKKRPEPGRAAAQCALLPYKYKAYLARPPLRRAGGKIAQKIKLDIVKKSSISVQGLVRWDEEVYY